MMKRQKKMISGMVPPEGGIEEKKAKERSNVKQGSGFHFLYTHVKREGTLRHSRLYRDICLYTYIHVHATITEISSETLSVTTPFRIHPQCIIKITFDDNLLFRRKNVYKIC